MVLCRLSETEVQICQRPFSTSYFIRQSGVLLREGAHLTPNKKLKWSELLKQFERIFKPEEEAIPNIKHHIHFRDHVPAATPPNRISFVKGLLDKELHRVWLPFWIRRTSSKAASHGNSKFVQKEMDLMSYIDWNLQHLTKSQAWRNQQRP